jgi:Tn3 transposase DDE domain
MWSPLPGAEPSASVWAQRSIQAYNDQPRAVSQLPQRCDRPSQSRAIRKMTGTCRPGKRRSGMRSSRTHTRTAARTRQRLALIQRSTPAEGSVGGVGGASTTTSRRLATATTSKGRCSGRFATTAPAASIRRLSLKAGIVAPSVMLRKLAADHRQNRLDLALQELGRLERTLFMLDRLESP